MKQYSNLLSLKVPGPDGSQVEIQAPSGIPTGEPGDAQRIIGFGLSLFLIACILLALAFILYGAFNWIRSQGDKSKIEGARKTITYAVVGLLIAFLALFVINIISNVLGVDLLKASF